MKIKEFGLTETKLFHFDRILKSRGQGGGSSDSPEPPLDPPLCTDGVVVVPFGMTLKPYCLGLVQTRKTHQRDFSFVDLNINHQLTILCDHTHLLFMKKRDLFHMNEMDLKFRNIVIFSNQCKILEIRKCYLMASMFAPGP